MTVFEREPEEEIIRRKIDSTRPLVRVTSSDSVDDFGDDLAVPRLLAYPIPEQGTDVPIIAIPKRPPWSASTSPEDLERQEQAAFAAWIAGVYREHPRERINFFEHNLEVRRMDVESVIGMLRLLPLPLNSVPACADSTGDPTRGGRFGGRCGGRWSAPTS